MKLHAYLRIGSSDETSAYGPEAQREDIEQWAAREKDCKIIGWRRFPDSGALSDREEVDRLVQEAYRLVFAGLLDGAIFGREDRLSPKSPTCLYFQQSLESEGVQVLKA
ncbi:MAG: hypothetical protein Q7T26_08700 [Dehalococcoidia bacterium]|nr:hypothetical protein [Dehalococcoidia bacterium]